MTDREFIDGLAEEECYCPPPELPHGEFCPPCRARRVQAERAHGEPTPTETALLRAGEELRDCLEDAYTHLTPPTSEALRNRIVGALQGWLLLSTVQSFLFAAAPGAGAAARPSDRALVEALAEAALETHVAEVALGAHVEQVAEAAERWWLGRRPTAFTEAQHLATPRINCITTDEAVLAVAVAEWKRTLAADALRRARELAKEER